MTSVYNYNEANPSTNSTLYKTTNSSTITVTKNTGVVTVTPGTTINPAVYPFATLTNPLWVNGTS